MRQTGSVLIRQKSGSVETAATLGLWHEILRVVTLSVDPWILKLRSTRRKSLKGMTIALAATRVNREDEIKIKERAILTERGQRYPHLPDD
jgi:hypothetical protein